MVKLITNHPHFIEVYEIGYARIWVRVVENGAPSILGLQQLLCRAEFSLVAQLLVPVLPWCRWHLRQILRILVRVTAVVKGMHLRCIGPCRSSWVENHCPFPFLIWTLFRHRRDGRGLVIHCLVRWPCTPWRRRWHSPGCRSRLLVNGMLYGSGFTRLNKIWVNYNISLTWILRPFGDDFLNINHDFQWGRTVSSWSTLPRFIE